jgi:hypothetical protein
MTDQSTSKVAQHVQESRTLPPWLTIHQMVTGYQLSQAMYVAAKLDLHAILAAGPKTSDEMAATVDAHPRTLYRLLRALASAGLFSEREDGRFESTALSAELWRVKLLFVGEESYRAWGDLHASVMTGEPAFGRVFGTTFFEYLQQNPEAATFWDDWNARTALERLPAAVAEYDFTRFGTLVDVGGGQGTFISTILQANPTLRGILFDLPDVVRAAPAMLEAAGVANRCSVVGGDFFQELPDGGDAYIISRVLLNWDDAEATRILANCRRAMGERGTLVVVDLIMPPPDHPARRVRAFNDLNLKLMFGASTRTEAEWRRLFAAAGFGFAVLTPNPPDLSVMEGAPTPV